MQIAITREGTTSTLVLDGRFDFSSHRDFRTATKTAIATPDVKTIAVDFSRVEYMDSSALGMLLLLRQGAEEAGKAVSLQGAAGSVRKVLEIANFNKLFPFA